MRSCELEVRACARDGRVKCSCGFVGASDSDSSGAFNTCTCDGGERMRTSSSRLVLVCVICTACGASDAANSDDSCDREPREVSLDAKFGDETPRAIIDLLERPVAGTVTWAAGESEDVDISGAMGTTTFHAQATAGPTVWVLEGIEGKGGILEDRIFCPTEFVFDVAIEFETDDGALVEDWEGRGTYGVSGTLGGIGTLEVIVEEPRPFAGTLNVTERPGVAERWETHELDIRLAFATYPLDFVGVNGGIRYLFQNSSGGEIAGVTTTIAEFGWAQ